MTHELALGGAGADQLLARLPEDVFDSLTPEQTTAIRKAAQERAWRDDHTVNIRLTIPFPVRPIYLGVVAGRERRNSTRQQILRIQHPLHTVGNFIFAAAGSALLTIALAIGLILGSILEF
jgi:hypothetical protein